MSKRNKRCIEFLMICIPIILILVLFASRTHSMHDSMNVEHIETIKEHLIVGDVYIVCLNGVKYYYVEDGISKLGLAPVYGTDGKVMFCKRR